MKNIHLNENYASRHFSVHRPRSPIYSIHDAFVNQPRDLEGFIQIGSSARAAIRRRTIIQPTIQDWTHWGALRVPSSSSVRVKVDEDKDLCTTLFSASLLLSVSESWWFCRTAPGRGARRPIADACISNATSTSIYLDFIVSQQTISRSESWWFCRIAGREKAAFSADTLAFQSQTALLHSCSTCTLLFLSSFLF